VILIVVIKQLNWIFFLFIKLEMKICIYEIIWFKRLIYVLLSIYLFHLLISITNKTIISSVRIIYLAILIALLVF